MKVKLIPIVLFLLFIRTASMGQQLHLNGELKISPFSLDQSKYHINFSTYYSIGNTNVFPLIYNFNYTLPKGAVFCRMEDALHKRFNLWIKFRMGNDDRYSN